MKAPKRALSVLAIGVALALAFFIVPAVTDSGQQASADAPFQLIYYDGHMHTTRSDGSGSVAQIKATAQARGLSAVIITDHCTSLTQAEWASLNTETADASDKSFLALPAFEITGNEGILNRGHMNAYNAPDPFVGDNSLERCPEEVWPDADEGGNPAGTGVMYPENLAKWASYVHSQGGIVNHNHTSGSTQLDYGVNNIEIYNQSHVDDVAGYAAELGYPPNVAWQFGIMLNNLAIYGERDLANVVPWPYPPYEITVKYAVYYATRIFTGVGQWLGSPQAPLNSWDDLLMAYVDGTVKRPTFGVANSDAHNTGDLCYWNEDGTARTDGKGTCCDKTAQGDPIENDSPPDGANGEDPQCIEAIDRDEPWDASGIGVAKNGLYVKALTADEVYKAIKAGRSFATTGPSLAFTVNGKMMGSAAYVASGGSVNLNLSVKAETAGYILAKIEIRKNGQVWKTIYPSYPTPTPAYSATLVDSVTGDGYYRVEVTSQNAAGAYQFAYSNPVFVDVP